MAVARHPDMARSRILVLLLASVACVSTGSEDEPRQETRTLRSVPGLAAVAVTERASTSAEARLGPVPDGCLSGDPAAFSLQADVAPAPGRETVIASSAHGVVVMDAADRRLGGVSFPCGGSDDRIVALAVGDVRIGTPGIVVVATQGGHRESSTRVDVLGFRADRLELLFSGEIERRDDETVAKGSVRITGDGLLHRDPDGRTTVWRADAWAHTLTRVEGER
jgi:hypothetical protein